MNNLVAPTNFIVSIIFFFDAMISRILFDTRSNALKHTMEPIKKSMAMAILIYFSKITYGGKQYPLR